MGVIDELKKQIANQPKPSPVDKLTSEALLRIKKYCIEDRKEVGHAFIDREIFHQISIPMISIEANASDDVNVAIEQAIAKIVEDGYFIRRELDSTLILTENGYAWLLK
ncbi:hypothetical protein [Sulfuricurvum sp.]|uniref:hypothetical protein n=1 Tax=Sulfuricurvum sp. TaxID=2025608 RepID=UPI00261E0D58|nr:hypothetical protein [Sulfuricurvum sp.]MDD2265460.1 hypothetical protein [Sulfuricurvum sp.]MDD2782883.1 hypothetical protein [Sulfuricurvum sp.]